MREGGRREGERKGKRGKIGAKHESWGGGKRDGGRTIHVDHIS